MASSKTRWEGQKISDRLGATKSDQKRFLSKLGSSVVSEMKTFIARGQSPVYDQGRFVPYKDKDKYPGDLKPSKPVNLYLTGEMLANLKHEVTDSGSVEVGIITNNQDILERALKHQNGTDNVPQRKFIPADSGDRFAIKIERMILNLQTEFFDDLIKKLNK